MPENFPPPNWGPAPFDERDLEAVLSGETVYIPPALRPVADTLAALRAPGAPAELSGEPTIMAEFRALPEFRALGLGEAARGAGPAQTLQLSVLPLDLPARRAARHRGRRRATSPVSRRVGVLMGTAAAAVIVVTAVFTTSLPGPIQRLAHLAHTSTASQSSRPAGSDSASPGLQATSAATEPAASPTASGHPTPSSSEASRLCHAYYGYVKHPGHPDSRPTEISLFHQLSKLAGGSSQVPGYCSPYLGDPWEPGNTGQGERGQGSGSGQAGLGGSGSGNGNSGSDQGNPSAEPSPHSS